MTEPQPITASANPPSTQGWRRETASAPDAQLRLVELQLQQLASIREIGMRLLEDLDEERDRPVEKRLSVAQRGATFDRVSKAIRQVMALEQDVIGMREKRAHMVEVQRGNVRKAQVQRSVERSLTTAKPDLDKPRREMLLRDLFSDYRKFATGSIPDLIAGICKDLGIPADLTLWEEPSYEDITLPAGYDWIVPANGDKPLYDRPGARRYQSPASVRFAQFRRPWRGAAGG